MKDRGYQRDTKYQRGHETQIVRDRVPVTESPKKTQSTRESKRQRLVDTVPETDSSRETERQREKDGVAERDSETESTRDIPERLKDRGKETE